MFGGIAAGGFVAAAAGTWAVIALSGALWVVTSVVSSRLSSALPPQKAAGELRGELAAVMADLVDGFRRISRTPAALAPVLTVAVGQFLQVMVIATVLVVMKESLGEGLVSFSGLVAAGGVGVFLGFLTAGALRSLMPSRLLIGAAFLLGFLALLPAIVGVDEIVLALTVGAVLLGVSYGWTRVPADTLAQRAVPDRYRGSVFTAIDLGFNTARVLGALGAVAVARCSAPAPPSPCWRCCSCSGRRWSPSGSGAAAERDRSAAGRSAASSGHRARSRLLGPHPSAPDQPDDDRERRDGARDRRTIHVLEAPLEACEATGLRSM